MRNYCKTIGALAAVSALVAGNASAEVEYELHTGYSNEYLFRGLNLGQDLIEVGADVKTEVSGIGLSAGAWYGSYDNANLFGNSNSDVGELDLFGQVSKNFGFLTGSIGYIYRSFESSDNNPDLGNPPSQELIFSVSRQICYGVDVSLTYFWGIEGENDGYSELAFSKSFELTQCLRLNLGSKLGYQVEEGQLATLTSRVSLDWGFVGSAKLSPFVAYSIALCDDNDTWYEGSKNLVVGGMMLSVGF
jgi:hypothetical protein